MGVSTAIRYTSVLRSRSRSSTPVTTRPRFEPSVVVGDEYFLAANLKHEGDVAYRLKDYSGARRAFDKYLVLRSDPEPSLRAERESVQALVNRLKGSR